MRVIAGKYRSRVLASFEGKDVRPTSDRVKESLFAILTPRLSQAAALDLFCGSGSLGIECLSRGASFVQFNDVAPESLAILKKNLSALREEALVTRADYRVCLQNLRRKFDLIFLDPPYALQAEAKDALERIARLRCLEEGGVAVYECETAAPEAEGLECFDTRSYGRTKLHFYRYPREEGNL